MRGEDPRQFKLRNSAGERPARDTNNLPGMIFQDPDPGTKFWRSGSGSYPCYLSIFGIYKKQTTVIKNFLIINNKR